MTYTEKELDQFLHGISLSLLSKKSAQHWRYDEETAKEIEWLEALERKVRADKADRKTEPQNDCEGCKHYVYQLGCTHHANCAYEPKTEPQTEKPKIRKRIDKPFRAVWLDDDHNEIGTPQTERSE